MDDKHDAVLRWPFLWVLVACCIFALPFTFHGGDLLLVMSLLTPLPYMFAIGEVWLACGAFATIWGGLRHRHWRRCLSALVLPAFLMLVGLNPREALSVAEAIGERVRLQFAKPGYFEKINAGRSDGAPRFASFPWGGWAGLALRSMIFDESDEILLDDSKRSAAWKKRVAGSELTCHFMAEHMEGHFYKVHYQC
jgi:hypothetical protein